MPDGGLEAGEAAPATTDREPGSELELIARSEVGVTETAWVALAGERAAAQRVALAFLASKPHDATRRAYQRDLADFFEFLAIYRISPLRVRRIEVDLYLEHLQQRGRATATRARRLAAIRGYYSYLLEEDVSSLIGAYGIPAKDPARRIKKPADTAAQRLGIPIDDVQRLLGRLEDHTRDAEARFARHVDAVDQARERTRHLKERRAAGGDVAKALARSENRLKTLRADVEPGGRAHKALQRALCERAMIALFIGTGARVSELVRAKRTDYGPHTGHQALRVIRKGGREQHLGVPRVVDRMVSEYLGDRKDGALLQTGSGNALDRHRAYVLVRRWAEQAGLFLPGGQYVGPHSLRHTFVTQSLNAGASLRDVQDAAGHADPRTTRRYDDERGALDRSPGWKLNEFLVPPQSDSEAAEPLE